MPNSVGGIVHDYTIKEWRSQPGAPTWYYYNCSCGETSRESISTRPNAVNFAERHKITGAMEKRYE